jgi:hypothetical protein
MHAIETIYFKCLISLRKIKKLFLSNFKVAKNKLFLASQNVLILEKYVKLINPLKHKVNNTFFLFSYQYIYLVNISFKLDNRERKRVLVLV